MSEPTDMQVHAALKRGEAIYDREPRAVAARYDRKRRRIVIDLTNGCSFSFPPRLTQGLELATDDQLTEVCLLGAGYGLHWESLDVDVSVPGLLAGIFGTASYMARRAGQAQSPAKTAAARANGAKGGRPSIRARGSV